MAVILKIATLVLAFFCLCVAASVSSRRGYILQLDHLQGNMKHEIICGSGTVDPNKFGHASGGRPETVSGVGSQPSDVRGGAIPLYAAGAAGGAANERHNNHHNGSNRICNGVEFVKLAFTILTYLLLLQSI